MSITVPIKFRSLGSGEKKQIIQLKNIIEEIGKEVALRTNNLDSLFTKVRSIVKEVIPSENDGLFSLTAERLSNLLATINQQEKIFRDDEMGIYQYELDEDLLHPIAHECVRLWNCVEGFDTPPFVAPTEESRSRKKARIEQALSKKQAAERQREEKIKKNAEERQQREDLKKSIMAPRRELDTISDALVVNPRPLGYIDYTSVPLDDPKEFTRALEIWTFLVSLPQVLTLSQFSLSMFISSILDDDDTFLIQETCRMLVKIGSKGSPQLRMAIKTTGRNWFDQVREYLAVASGAKQKRKEAIEQKKTEKRNRDFSGSDAEGDAVEEEHDDDDNEESEGLEEDIDFATDFSDMMKAMEEIKRVSWGNLQVHDRLVLLKFLVDSILQAPAIIDDVERVVASDTAEQITLERVLKEHRDEHEKELRLLAKKKLDPETTASEKEALIAKLKHNLDLAFAKRMDSSEKQDIGTRVLPIGEDRYGRLYWRFPLDPNVYVQTTPLTKKFPIVDKPKVAFFDDDETVPASLETPACGTAPQTVWGKIVPADLEPFICSLDVRGSKEHALKNELERLVNHLTSLALPNDRIRITRTRAINKGYINKLNIPEMLPY